jgi:hypothetical protein
MELNSILIDILDWVRKLVWGRENNKEYTPYKVLKMEHTLFGILKMVTRDTPRAVSTYIFTPFAPPKYSNEPHNDYHMCLDYLGKIDYTENEVPKPKEPVHKSFRLTKPIKKIHKVENSYTVISREGTKYSHCITILKANRFPNRQGNYNSKVIYQGYYDLIGSEWLRYRDRWAVVIFQDMVNQTKSKDISLLNFNDIIEASRQKYLGRYYKPNSGVFYTDSSL